MGHGAARRGGCCVGRAFASKLDPYTAERARSVGEACDRSGDFGGAGDGDFAEERRDVAGEARRGFRPRRLEEPGIGGGAQSSVEHGDIDEVTRGRWVSDHANFEFADGGQAPRAPTADEAVAVIVGLRQGAGSNPECPRKFVWRIHLGHKSSEVQRAGLPRLDLSVGCVTLTCAPGFKSESLYVAPGRARSEALLRSGLFFGLYFEQAGDCSLGNTVDHDRHSGSWRGHALAEHFPGRCCDACLIGNHFGRTNRFIAEGHQSDQRA